MITIGDGALIMGETFVDETIVCEGKHRIYECYFVRCKIDGIVIDGVHVGGNIFDADCVINGGKEQAHEAT